MAPSNLDFSAGMQYLNGSYSGTGKTHVSTALGIAACGRGCKVRFFRVTELITQLMEAREKKKSE